MDTSPAVRHKNKTHGINSCLDRCVHVLDAGHPAHFNPGSHLTVDRYPSRSDVSAAPGSFARMNDSPMSTA
jgi:hypothetical protein